MTVDILKLQEYKEANDKLAFNKILVDFLPHLRKVIYHKIRHLEKRGVIPRNMYSAQEIVDDVYLKIFEEYTSELNDVSRLKVRMFSIVKELLDNIANKHNGNSISVESLYREEIKDLEEKFTIDADEELVMIDELDDISYHLEEYKDKILLLYNDEIEELAQKLDIGDFSNLSDYRKKSINKAFSDLPELSQSIISHFVFGKLTVEELSEVHKIPAKVAVEIIEKTKKRFSDIIE